MSKLRPRRRNHHCCKHQLRLHNLRNFRNLRCLRNLASWQIVSRDDALQRFRGQRRVASGPGPLDSPQPRLGPLIALKLRSSESKWEICHVAAVGPAGNTPTENTAIRFDTMPSQPSSQAAR